MIDRTWTISNILSISRIALVAPIAFLLLGEGESNRSWAIIAMIIAVLTDTFDGILARAMRQETELGRILDPLADKIAVAAVSVLLMIRGVLPFWFVILAVARDVLILAGAMYLKAKRRTVLQSNTLGKWTVTVVALYIVASTLGGDSLDTARSVLLGISTALLLASFGVYARRFYTTMVRG